MNKNNAEKNNSNKNNKKMWLLVLLSIILIILIITTALLLVKDNKEQEENTLAYTDLIKEISYGNVEKVELTTGSRNAKVKMKNEEEEKKALIPDTEAFITLIQTKVAEGNEIELVQKPQSFGQPCQQQYYHYYQQQ